MSHTDLLIIFIAVTSIAVVLQMLILAGMYFSVRKMGESVTAMQARMNEQVLPLVEKVRTLVDQSGPAIQSTIENVNQTSALLRVQAERVDETVSGVLDVARAQAELAGAVASRALVRLDTAVDTVQHAVVTPVRRFSALLEAVAVGFGDFTGRHKVQRTRDAVPRDEMFI